MYDDEMRRFASLLTLLLLISSASAQHASPANAVQDTRDQTAYCPQTHALQVSPSAKYWFQGDIGKTAIRMFLDRGGNGVVGLFYATAGNWTPTLLGGDWGSTGISLSAQSDNRTLTGRLQGRLAKNAFIGSWTPANSHQAQPVRLTATPEPACDGKGAWKQFSDPKWPLSFSYPASWRMKQEGHTIELICPDPEAMAYNTEVTVQMGTGAPAGAGVLQHCANGWRYGSLCDCGARENTCQVPKITQSQGNTFLNLDQSEWRVYCRNGGYVGQGYGADRFVLLKNHWFEAYATGAGSAIIKRLVQTVNTRAAGKTQQ